DRIGCTIPPKAEIPIWHVTQGEKIHRQQVKPAVAEILFCGHQEVIPEMDEKRAAQHGTQADAIIISLIAEFPPAPVHVQDRPQVVMAEMRGASRGVVDQIPASGADAKSEIGVLATE